MNMRDYAILASVSHEAKSGYDVAKWFDLVASHFCSAGYGSVYPALGRFEREGWVVHEAVPSEKGPERKVYSVTEKGMDALLGWSGEPAADAQTRDEQLVKALSYGFLPAERALELLEGARRRHGEKLAYFRGLEAKLKRGREEGGISEEAYVGTMLTLLRGIGVEESYVGWCDRATAFVQARRAR